MLITVKARYRQGRIEPLEPLDLEEGKDIIVTVEYSETMEPNEEPTVSTAGAWKDLLDCEAFEQEVYQNRLVQTRPEVRL
jgi:predicted DNA-binding antitoxin AbrB/MazE fold protein